MQISDVPSGCSQYINSHTEVPTFCDKNVYDNFYVQHPIPRSTKQYAWITASIEADHEWVGYAPKDWYVKKSALGMDISSGEEYVPCYNLCSASEFGSYFNTSLGYQAWGNTEAGASSQSRPGFIPTSVDLNSHVYEPVTSSTNTLGMPIGTPLLTVATSDIQYLNRTFVPVVTDIGATPQVPDYAAQLFNSLMIKRNGFYGWPSWKPLRMAEHPITRNERKNNVFSAVSEDNDGTFKTYNMPPVSNRARPDLINMYYNQPYSNSIITFRSTGENEQIYFNRKVTNDRYAPERDAYITPTQQMLQLINMGGQQLNWVVKTQQIFPSIRNEFVSYSYGKPTYDNLYWRDNREQRNSVNSILDRYGAASGSQSSASVPSYSTENSFGIYVSQSAWPLDAPVDFLTRGSVFMQVGDLGPSGLTPVFFNHPTARFTSASAGELQNIYMGFATGSRIDQYIASFYNLGQGPSYVQFYTQGINAIGSLYARKHALYGPATVKSPYGPRLPYASLTGALTPAIVSQSFSRDVSTLTSLGIVDLGAGEALWEAPRLAGYVTRSNNGADEWVSAPSKPWADSYEDFRYHIKLSAKGYSILPEFRISEHMDEYLENDNSFTGFNDLNLEIPHVAGANSKQDEDFYISYSNSEFLRDFLKIRREALMAATEIKVACTGAIKFNPYKGFYPAQRTIQLAEAFKDSYLNNLVSAYGPFYGAEGASFQPGNRIYDSVDPASNTGLQVLSPNTGSWPQGAQYTPFGQGISYTLRPMINTLFSPGILYNSIKSGIAVDYPIVTTPGKIKYREFSRTGDSDRPFSGSYAVTMESGAFNGLEYAKKNDLKWSFFDQRLPFETMVEPEKYLEGIPFYDMEPHQSYGLRPFTASFIANQSKKNYNLMARNFFGAVPSFFLQNGEFTNIKSALSEGSRLFSGSQVYAMRVKLDRSSKGPRTYEHEVDGNYGVPDGEDSQGNKISLYAKYGGMPISQMQIADDMGCTPTFQTGNTGLNGLPGGAAAAYFPLPQDPIYNPLFKETFTMYSRPTAFGPPIAGRYFSGLAAGPYYSGALDSFCGINPGYTPPYYNGEAWADFIFRPESGRSYTLEDIMSETETMYWRFDGGSRISSSNWNSLLLQPFNAQSKALIPDLIYQNDGQLTEYGAYPYGGSMINDSSMQLSASFNMFGIQKENFVEVDKFGNVDATRPGTKIGTRWVIRSKFETPMLNFSDEGINPISGANITFPENYGGASTPRGMWHQFGSIPTGTAGVHMSVEDIPKNWLQNHYMVKDYRSIYNNNEPDVSMANKVKSLADLVGFKNDKTKMGVLKEQHTIREAVVAIPYIIEKSQSKKKIPEIEPLNDTKKSFIQIPPQRYAAAAKQAFGSAAGDSFAAAGASISKQLQKMQRYVFPPQLDFINNPAGAVDPFVMYIFEFEYNLDKNDLSYIWQNLAPREFDKLTYQTKSTAHALMDAELLNESILLENEQLRWMVFKVKQKAQDDYWSKTDEQIGSNNANSYAQNDLKGLTKEGLPEYELAYNWPYDYVSIVEMVKVNCDILYNEALAPWEVYGTEAMDGPPPPGDIWVPPFGPPGTSPYDPGPVYGKEADAESDEDTDEDDQDTEKYVPPEKPFMPKTGGTGGGGSGGGGLIGPGGIKLGGGITAKPKSFGEGRYGVVVSGKFGKGKKK